MNNPNNFYRLTPFWETLTFLAVQATGAGINLAAANLYTGSLVVNAGDRIAVRVIAQASPITGISDVSLLEGPLVGCSASLSYTPS